ncbi:murein biosynthesis integral membrane protein MurJ [Rhodobacteraceae bacterium XHP0102]|nr:murein biosynthesis integral membrane protein MurJ [Rhodobacteraceae bacterium XHP0102]
MARSPIRLGFGFLTVGSWTLVSRVFGFLRDILIARYLGAGGVAEAFLVAFALPNMFRRFFAEGAMNTAFVPIFAKKLEAEGDALPFARNAFSMLGVFLILFTLLAQIAMPWLVLAMASGFAGDARFEIAVELGRICFVYILLISLAALISGMLNAAGRFAAAAAAPVLLNVILVSALIYGAQSAADSPDAARRIGLALSWGVPVAGLAQVFLVWWAAARAGFVVRPVVPKLTPDLRRLAIVAGPAMLAGGVVQINLLVGRQVASFFDGAIAWLSYADRLYQLPLGVVGIAIGVVLLPALSRRLRAGDTAGGRVALSRAAEIGMILTIPAAVALVVIPVPLVSVLFERGAFGASDTIATAWAVAIYGAGLPAFVLQKIWQPVFYAREDTKRPFQYALVAMVVNAVLAIGLAFFIGYIAAALATTLAAWVMAYQLRLGAKSYGDVAAYDARYLSRIPRIAGAAAAMGLVLYGASLPLAPVFAEGGGLRYLALAGLIGLGMASYAVFGRLFGAFSFRDLRGALSRQGAA